MTKRESEYFANKKYWNKRYIGGLIKINPLRYHGYLMDIPFIYEDMQLNKMYNGIIKKAKVGKHSTTLTISPKKIIDANKAFL